MDCTTHIDLWFDKHVSVALEAIGLALLVLIGLKLWGKV
jgi:hypothetical protein